MSATDVPARAVLTAIEQAADWHLGALSSAAGFLPPSPPSTALPETHAAWDEAAAALPRMWRDLSARRDLADLPVLGAGPDSLEDADLWRASVVLSALVYAYVRCDIDDLHLAAPAPVPAPLLEPWATVAARMGRRAAHVALDDLVLHNWRLRDETRSDPMRVDNLALLVPQTGNAAESSFFLTFLEMVAQGQPLVDAIVAGQEAAVDRDAEALTAALLVVLDRVRHLTEISFNKLDPVADAATYADPAVWAKLTAPTGIPVVADVPGVSGAAAAPMQAIDAFLGRTRFDTHLGKEARHLLDWYAPNVRDFVEAAGAMSIADAVAASNDRSLQGLFQTVVDAYAGDRGYLGVHRRKVYGFIQTAFKVGRPSTASGIAGLWRDRAWRTTHHLLEDARLERYAELHHQRITARLRDRTRAGSGSSGQVEGVGLDVADMGLTYRPGDRLAVLPTNDPALVERTLTLLRATGDELVPLPPAWRIALRRRTGEEIDERAPLSLMLAHAWLRPLTRDVTKRLHQLSGAPALRAVLEARTEDTWEFPDALEALASSNFDPGRLWRAEPVDPEALARILPPAPARLYSVSGAPDGAPFSDTVTLTVGRLQFPSQSAGGETVTRHGTASTLLTARMEPDDVLPVEVVRPQRFSLPPETATPVVMFAAGTGIAPFMGFVEARAAEPDAGSNWLLVAVRTPDHVPHRARLDAWVADGVLRVDLAASRVPDNPRRIDGLLADPDVGRDLWGLLHDGGAHVYVCGQGGFAAAVLDGLRMVAREHGGLDEAGARLAVRRLVADRRLQMDIFTTFQPAGQLRPGERLIDTSEMARHHDDEHGWWTEIAGVVYDLTEFRHLHPGGRRIIDDNAGVDATGEYQEVQHHLDPEIQAMLAMYRIGLVRRLALHGPWGAAVSSGAVRAVSLEQLYRQWVRELHTVTELTNSLRNDGSVLAEALTNAEQPGDQTALKVGLFVDLQQRVLGQYLGIALGDELADLWAVTACCTDPAVDAHALGRRLRAVLGGDGGGAHWPDVREPLRALLQAADPARTRAAVEAALDANRTMFAAMGEALRRGLMVFERHERATLDVGGPALLAELDAIPDAVAAGRRALREALRATSEVHA